MKLGMIWAEARGGAIGRGGEMPWHLPEDLAHFRKSTTGAPVIMGRRTWESLPERFRPLPGRENVVVSRDSTFVAEGARVVTSLEDALALFGAGAGAGADMAAESADIVWIMGGGQLYRSAMPLADELLVTRIDLEVTDADTFAPEIGPEWTLIDPGTQLEAANGTPYRFERYVRA